MSKLLPFILFYLFLIPMLIGQSIIKDRVVDKKEDLGPGVEKICKQKKLFAKNGYC